jgi:hypothetical protein
MILTTILCPFRSPTLRFNSRKPLAIVLTESDGLQKEEPGSVRSSVRELPVEGVSTHCQ